MIKSLPNLLIVDDNYSNIEFLRVILSKFEINLIKAESGFDALQKTKDIDLALAILDVQMPMMDGYELALKINEPRRNDKVPIIFVTANSYNEIDINKGYSSGAADFIYKPINKSILLSKVKIFLDLFNQKQTIIKEAKLLKKTSDELIWVNAALKRSEFKYRSYIENAPDGVFVVDEKGRYIDINEATCRMTGYSKDEILSMTITDLLPDKLRNIGLTQFNTLVKTGNLKVDFLFEHKNGSKRWWAFEAVNLTEIIFLCYAKDITLRKDLEESLLAYQLELEKQNKELEKQNDEIKLAKNLAEVVSHKYAELYDFAPSGFFTLSYEKRIKELNHSGALMLGEERSRLTDRNFISFISDDSRTNFNSFFEDIQRIKEKQTCDTILKTDKKQTTYVHIEGLFDVNNEQILLNVIDITELKDIEKAVRESEEKFRAVTQSANDAIITANDSGIILTWNSGAEKIFGYKDEEIIGKNLVTLMPECIATKHPISIINHLNSSEHYNTGKTTELFGLHKSRNEFPLELSLSEWETASGKFFTGIIRDITERKLTEQTLKISEEKYRTILNASPDGILLIDLKGIITEVSEIGLKIFDTDTRNDLVGKYLYQFIPPEETNTIKDIFEKTMIEGLIQNVELKIRKKNQSVFFSEVSSTLIQAPNGEPLSFMIIIRDISQRKKIEAKQIHADRMANLGEMASGIAHEINQPLNIISMVMDKILFETNKTETINIEFLKTKSDKIFDNITRIRNIIDHVRAFSRSDDHYLLTAFNINTSIENATSLMLEQFNYLGITLTLNLNYNISPLVGNTFKLEQVIVNLLTNAKDAVLERKSKYSDYSDLEVKIRTYQENQSLIIEIIDNGIGIDKDDIQNIVLPFYTTKEEGKGTGLGLSICYQIIREMNGTIDITSDGINGTKIKLVLNIQKTN